MDNAKTFYKNIKNKAGSYVSDMKKGAKPRGVKESLLDLVGMKDGVDAFFEKLLQSAKMYASLFGMCCFICFCILSIGTFVSVFTGVANSGCISEGNIGLANSPQMVRPFYNHVLEWFFGNGTNIGIVKTIRDNILKNNSFQLIKTLCIIVSIAFLGLGYVMGTIEMKMKDLITLCVKLSFISFLTDAKSIYFLDKYIVSVFLNTVDYVTSLVQGLVLKSVIGNIDNLPSDLVKIVNGSINKGTFNPISMIDRIVGIMFSGPFFSKILAMFSWNIMMTPVIVVLFFIMLFFLGSMVKVIMHLLYLRIAIGISFTMMPIFLCLLLFENTKKIAQNYFEDGLIEPAFNYFFTVLFVSIFCFVALGYISEAFYFKACQKFVNVKQILTPESLIGLAFLLLIMPMASVLLLLPINIVENFQFDVFVVNLFLFFVANVVIYYNIDSIQSMADKLSNAFNFNPHSRKKGDGETPFGKGASKFGGAITGQFSKDKILGKHSVDKDGKSVVKGGLLSATDKVFKTSLRGYVHGQHGVGQNIANYSNKFFGGILSKYRNENATNTKTLLSPAMRLAGKYLSSKDATRKDKTIEQRRKEMFASKKDAANALSHIKRIEDSIKRENPGLSANDLQRRVKEKFKEDYKDSSLTKSDIERRFNFLSFDYKQDKNGKESSKFHDLITTYNDDVRKDGKVGNKLKSARDEFVKMNKGLSEAGNYFDRQMFEYKKSIEYNAIVELEKKTIEESKELIEKQNKLEQRIKDIEKNHKIEKDKNDNRTQDQKDKAAMDILSNFHKLQAEVVRLQNIIDDPEAENKKLAAKINILETESQNFYTKEERDLKIKVLKDSYEDDKKNARHNLSLTMDKLFQQKIELQQMQLESMKEYKEKAPDMNVDILRETKDQREKREKFEQEWNQKEDIKNKAMEIIENDERYKEKMSKIAELEKAAKKLIDAKNNAA